MKHAHTSVAPAQTEHLVVQGTLSASAPVQVASGFGFVLKPDIE
jgi:hypothetical protein